MLSMFEKVLQHNGLVTAFALVGIIMGLSMWLSKRLTFGRLHGSAVAIMIGLVLAYWGGIRTGGERGLAEPQVSDIVAQVHSPAPPAYVANLKAERQIVVADSDAALAQVLARAGARRGGGNLALHGGAIALPAA